MLAERLFRLFSLFALGIGVAVVGTQGLGSSPTDSQQEQTLQVVAKKISEIRDLTEVQSINQGKMNSSQIAVVQTGE